VLLHSEHLTRQRQNTKYEIKADWHDNVKMTKAHQPTHEHTLHVCVRVNTVAHIRLVCTTHLHAASQWTALSNTLTGKTNLHPCQQSVSWPAHTCLPSDGITLRVRHTKHLAKICITHLSTVQDSQITRLHVQLYRNQWRFTHHSTQYIPTNRMYGDKKVKISHYRPGQALTGPGGWRSQDFQIIGHEGGKVVSSTHRPP
jgi:hypothetical protein